jgi:SAM-dependent methyltransferase
MPGDPLAACRWSIDECSQVRVAGWIDDNGPVDAIDIAINGGTVATISPQMYRKDLEDLGIGDGKRGFVFEIEKYLTSLVNDIVIIYSGRILYSGKLSRRPVLSTPLPDDDLIELVVGHRNREAFAESRQHAVDTILGMLGDIGVNARDFRSILDFGCGCGRILAGWEGLLHPGTELHGCDINERLVRFCQENVKHAQIVQSNYLPPLPYPDHKFEFIYAASVYTHLTLPAMLSWTGEIARIVKRGGIAMITIHGSCFASALAQASKEGSRILAERGYYVHLHGDPEDTWLGSSNYATFVTPDFMRRIFGGFDLIRASPGISHGPTHHFMRYQDVLIFRRAWP